MSISYTEKDCLLSLTVMCGVSEDYPKYGCLWYTIINPNKGNITL